MLAVRGWLLLGLIAIAACGSVQSEEPDAGDDMTDGGAVIDGGTAIDAGFDAGGAPDAAGIPRSKSSEITSGAGRVSGSVYTTDVQVGHGYAQGSTMGSVFSVEGATAIRP